MRGLSKHFGILAALTLMACGPVTASADEMAYVAVEGYSPASVQFGTLDLTTGAYSAINNNAISTGNKTVNGMAVSNGKLYAVDRGSDLYQVDPTTGDFTLVGSGGPSDKYYTIGSTSNGNLYGLDMNGDLYSVDPTTGNATDIGSTVGFPASSHGPYYPYETGLSNGSSTLYYAQPDSSVIDEIDFYSINTATGAGTFDSQFLSTANGITPLLEEDGTLYGDMTTQDNTRPYAVHQYIVTIDPVTGAVTQGPEILPTDNGNLSIMGMVAMDSVATVPLPASVLGGGALLSLVAMKRRRMNSRA